MKESIFMFTFNPIQPFIEEARRAADLFTGSQILVELSRAAATAIQNAGGILIYPVNLAGDIPNKIVARIDGERVDYVANSATEALTLKWCDISNSAKRFLEEKNPKPDKLWVDIWERQTNSIWDVYWSSVVLEGRGFKESMALANQALESTKRSRAFANNDGNLETGFKDTLSGKRSALRTSDLDAREYWTVLSQNFRSSKLKQDGGERLDALGSIKRFSTIAKKPFASTSSIASSDFLTRLLSTDTGKEVLADYAKAVEKLGCFRVSSKSSIWPFDGDLLYPHLLTEKRLKSDYHLSSIAADDLRIAKEKLAQLIRGVGQPSPYYAVIVIDGDSMGEWVSACNTIEESQSISERLDKFSSAVKNSTDHKNGFFAQPIYNGGDDVMLMAPLSTAVSIAKKLADEFEKQTEGRSASAGIVICHHQSQLSFALKLVREAESTAKKIPGKSGVCVKVFKRSGAPYTAVSHWNDLGTKLDEFIDMFKNNILSSRFAYDVQDEGRTAAFMEQNAQKALLKRLVNRHKQEGQIDISNLVDTLSAWSIGLNWETNEPGLIKLSNWLVLARFIAQGGIEE